MKRMLVNATQSEELRVAMVDGQTLYDLDIEVPGKAQNKANIYKGKITRVEPSLEAAFVEYGGNRHGFLPFKEISRQYFSEDSTESDGRLTIRDAMSEGQELIVQVEKEERGNKGAALTTLISLAGRYLVLMPNNPRAGGISRRVEGDERTDLREALSTLDVPPGMGLIVRTAGVGRAAEELQWDLDYLLQLWKAIEAAELEHRAPKLLFQESNVIIRALRDYFRQDINEILIDTEKVYNEAHDFMQQVMPASASKVKLYKDNVPLFSRYQIESKIEAAFGHQVRLPSGGSIVIDHTEALVSIDINSARATKGSDIEETALNTNVEAADEIARQLRIRDIGGLIVIDFIDMGPHRNQRDVENRLRDALEPDRARVQVGRISRFGLLEMSRQRLRPSLGEASLHVCPRCHGRGHMRGSESLSLAVLRVLEEEAMKEKTGRVLAKVPLEMGTFLLNEKREAIQAVQTRHGVDIIVVPDPHLETPNYEIERVRSDDAEHASRGRPSYELAITPDPVPEFAREETKSPTTEPAVRRLTPNTQAPGLRSTAGQQRVGLFRRLISMLSGTTKTDEKSEAEQGHAGQRRSPRSPGGARRRSGTNNTRRRNDPRRGRERPSGERRLDASGGNERGRSRDPGNSERHGDRQGRRPRRRPSDASVTEHDAENESLASEVTEPRLENQDSTGEVERSGRRRGGRRGRRGGRQRRQANPDSPREDNLPSDATVNSISTESTATPNRGITTMSDTPRNTKSNAPSQETETRSISERTTRDYTERKGPSDASSVTTQSTSFPSSPTSEHDPASSGGNSERAAAGHASADDHSGLGGHSSEAQTKRPAPLKENGGRDRTD